MSPFQCAWKVNMLAWIRTASNNYSPSSYYTKVQRKTFWGIWLPGAKCYVAALHYHTNSPSEKSLSYDIQLPESVVKSVTRLHVQKNLKSFDPIDMISLHTGLLLAFQIACNVTKIHGGPSTLHFPYNMKIPSAHAGTTLLYLKSEFLQNGGAEKFLKSYSQFIHNLLGTYFKDGAKPGIDSYTKTFSQSSYMWQLVFRIPCGWGCWAAHSFIKTPSYKALIIDNFPILLKIA